MQKFYTLDQFQSQFPSDDACLDQIMQTRYGPRPSCPRCKRASKFHRIAKRRAYCCQFCGHQVYPCVGPHLMRSSTPLHKWFYAMFLFTTSRNGISAKELERQLGVTYKTTWRMARQTRSTMECARQILDGVVEADETFIGGKTRGRNWRAKKVIVFGVKERGGDVRTKVVNNTKRQTLEPIVRRNVRQCSLVNTDEASAYRGLGRRGYRHLSVQHRRWQWANGLASTNGIEGYTGVSARQIEIWMAISKSKRPCSKKGGRGRLVSLNV